MSIFERISLWIATISGAMFAAGSFYLAAAASFHWWPYPDVASAAQPDAPMIVPTWALILFALLGVALLLTVLSYRFRRAPAKISTTLILQFGAAALNPLCITMQNIANWYILAGVQVRLNPKTGREVERTIHSQSLFLVFDRPITFSQITLLANSAPHPHYEVKNAGSRHAVIYIEGSLENTTLTVMVAP